jgi:hypothetical protein
MMTGRAGGSRRKACTRRNLIPVVATKISLPPPVPFAMPYSPTGRLTRISAAVPPPLYLRLRRLPGRFLPGSGRDARRQRWSRSIVVRRTEPVQTLESLVDCWLVGSECDSESLKSSLKKNKKTLERKRQIDRMPNCFGCRLWMLTNTSRDAVSRFRS